MARLVSQGLRPGSLLVLVIFFFATQRRVVMIARLLGGRGVVGMGDVGGQGGGYRKG